MGEETWVQRFEPESMHKLIEWHHMTTPKKKKFKSALSAGKIMVTDFWDTNGVILVNFLSSGTTVSSDCYVETQRNLNARHHQVHPTTKMSEVLLIHSSARRYISVCTTEKNINLDGQCYCIHPIVLICTIRYDLCEPLRKKSARTPLCQ
jgi:hypothetical protein